MSDEVAKLAWRQRLRRAIGTAAVGIAVISGGIAVIAVSHSASDNHRAIVNNDAKLRGDNTTLCAFFRTTDETLEKAFQGAPTSAAGRGFRAAFGGLQLAARRVALSPICPPP